MILLDTGALIWLDRGHPRARPLTRAPGRPYVSPATILELQFLLEGGRIRLRGALADLVASPRWLVDDPPATPWFMRALDAGWTRDPFDRLLVAHARFRGWKLATGDGVLLERLSPAERLEL